MMIEGLHTVVSDKGRVPSIKVVNDNAPEHTLQPGFLSALRLHQTRGANLNFQKNKNNICYYNTYQVIQFDCLPLVGSFIANGNELAPLFEELRQVVEVS
ncbi:unnamed protein product [Nyctereutes procyonoides]|uniref:Ragulator complex protein LAMTOR3 n=1 Tax=Nyctereutes procyonoides TaxID=34880 RepID=A0A811Z339_NYCPR|nr:unnamed protein product [Nyctereutes procyonoides]